MPIDLLVYIRSNLLDLILWSGECLRYRSMVFAFIFNNKLPETPYLKSTELFIKEK